MPGIQNVLYKLLLTNRPTIYYIHITGLSQARFRRRSFRVPNALKTINNAQGSSDDYLLLLRGYFFVCYVTRAQN